MLSHSFIRAVTASLLLAGCLHAAPVAIGDPSFEGNDLGPNDWNSYIGPEWTGTFGTQNNNAFEEYIPGFVADGTDHLGMAEGYDVWQDLGTTFQAGMRYTLTVAIGHRLNSTASGNESRYALADSTGTVHATTSSNASLLPAQSFADAPALVFDVAAGSPAVGQTIRVLLQARGSNRSHFDNLRLDATSINPPGSATLDGLAATAVTTATATLNGTVTDIGNDAPAITFFWGTDDGGTTATAWQYQSTLPGTHSGAFSLPITSLDPAVTYRFTARATNSAGDSWVIQSADFQTPPLPPAVATTAAGDIEATSATLAASITADGGETPTVILYHGTTDGGATPGAWDGFVTLEPGTTPLSATVSGLSPATPYFFRAFASNSGGTSWAPTALGFTTLTIAAPVVENRSTQGITGTTANIRGDITEDGNDDPTVTLFHGTIDGGTDPGAWQHSTSIGIQSNDFSKFVSNLSPSTPVFFRWRAVNGAGTAWSSETGTFTTTALLPGTPVITEFHYNTDDNTQPIEFIELYNPGDTALDLAGWTLSDAVTFTFPPATTLPVGGYLVIAENPAALESQFAITGVLGPWNGRLSSAGESIDLRDAAGTLHDRVEYKAGFPWPTGADGAGSSAELIHAGLDNDLSGSWRSSGSFIETTTTYIPTNDTGWRYFKGNTEASDPVQAWRALAYDDSGWSTGQAGIGYGYTAGINTVLDDMRYNYSTVYCRKSFTVPAGNIPQQLKLKIRIDDGCVIWINGTEVDRRYVANGQLPYNQLATNHTREWQEIIIDNADTLLVGGTNVVAVHAINTTLRSSDLSMDLELTSFSDYSALPTPGSPNSSRRAAEDIPPQIRQVSHSPDAPLPGQPVAVTARITDPDGMGPVSLSYQTIEPGSYIRLTDPLYQTSWTSVPMFDDGTNGDVVPGDSTYTAVLPEELQTHRRLVRYRITFADSLGNSQTVPYADDEQPNFAYFVYAGLPSWTGAMRPYSYSGFPATTPETYSSGLLESMPPFHLIADAADVTNCQYNGAYNDTRFRGTVIHRGVIHDHIEFRVRGIGSTYQSGKNKWNIYFNRARDYQAYDNYGKPYKRTWNNLLVNANASPWASVNRGSAGVEEAVSNRIFQVAGMAAMHTQFFHFRVIDDAVETSPTDQYSGDLWGLYLGLEPTEGHFLDERDLPDGNIYSIEGNGGDKTHQGPTQPTDSSDWNTFRTGLAATGQTEQWYRDNVDLPTLYTFLALNRLIGNVDVRPGDNYRFYHRPTDDRWVIIPYDLDMQFIAAHHWGGTMDGVVVAGAPNVIRAISRHPAIAREYRNRCREILSLMASDASPSGGQIGQLIRDYAALVHPAGETLTWANLDAAMWNLHPRTNGNGANTGQTNHRGNFFRADYLDGSRGVGGTVTTSTWIRTLADPDADGFSDHESLMQWFVNFSTNTWPGGTWNRKAMTGIGTGNDSDPNRQLGFGYKYLEFEALYGGWTDSKLNPSTPAHDDFPDTPVVTYTGAPGHPITGLTFESTAFSDPDGAATYSAHEWRVARLYAPGIPGFVAGTPPSYEMETLWASGELSDGSTTLDLPLGIAEPGETYRVRIRHLDTDGNWSYWSDPVEFGATQAPATDLVHYWNFNNPATLLVPTQTIGGGTLAVTGEFLSDDGKDFAGANARNGDLPATHLRINDPVTPGATVTATLPTVGFDNIIVKYESRRSSKGAEIQNVSYTLDGTNYAPFTTFSVDDDDPVILTLDFRSLPATHDNPYFGIHIAFAQGDGGTAGNDRIDNLTVDGNPLPAGYNTWRFTWFPDPADFTDDAISGPNASPSGDGVANLIRYSLGTGPYESTAGLMPTLTHSGGTYDFSFRYDPAKTDLRWQVTGSNDLTNWISKLFDSETDTIPPLVDGWLTVPLPPHLGPGPDPDPRIFTRLELEIVSP